jgi:pyruvate kinase
MDKKTKIVATISDRRCEPEFIKELFDAGMNVVRMNSAHLNRDGFQRIISNVRSVSDRIAIMMDTKGPEIRTTVNETDDNIYFTAGQKVTFAGDVTGTTSAEHINLNYANIANDIVEGKHLLIDDGELDFLVDSVDKEAGLVYATVQNDGKLGSRKSVNIPGVSISLPAVTERDRENIAIAVELGVDFIAHSFVRSAADVHAVQEILDSMDSDIKIISKIENQEGIDNIDEIIDASYGIMIARGDLGIEVAAERIPGIQAMMIKRSIAAHKPVIVATQMLHSMINNPRPTRAEVSDIANAVYQRTDAVMLSGETASGKYPVEAVTTMARVVMEVEKTLRNNMVEVPPLSDAHVTSFLARQAVVSERMIGTKAIITDSFHGRTARYIASFRASTPVFAICHKQSVTRWLSLSYGIKAYYYENYDPASRYPTHVLRRFINEGLLHRPDRVAYLGALNGTGSTFLEINSVNAIIEYASNPTAN